MSGMTFTTAYYVYIWDSSNILLSTDVWYNRSTVSGSIATYMGVRRTSICTIVWHRLGKVGTRVRLGFTLLTSAPTSQYWCLHIQHTVIQYYSTTVTYWEHPDWYGMTSKEWNLIGGSGLSLCTKYCCTERRVVRCCHSEYRCTDY
jgi:hypothetical protein